MSKTLHDALQRYRTAVLELTAGDLMALKADIPRHASAVASASLARKDVLEAGRNLTAEQFTAELMTSNFLKG